MAVPDLIQTRNGMCLIEKDISEERREKYG